MTWRLVATVLGVTVVCGIGYAMTYRTHDIDPLWWAATWLLAGMSLFVLAHSFDLTDATAWPGQPVVGDADRGRASADVGRLRVALDRASDGNRRAIQDVQEYLTNLVEVRQAAAAHPVALSPALEDYLTRPARYPKPRELDSFLKEIDAL